MKHFYTFLFVLGCLYSAHSQTIDFENDKSINNLFIKLYGEVHYNQPVKSGVYNQGTFDAKRIVALFGYQFNRETQFITEWEVEHANEIFVEQAFIKHKLDNNLALKAGMILIPMGLVNENHEPTFFKSVDRPMIDKILVPTTWRDIGVGITGIFQNASLKYQAYLVNGLSGFENETALFKSSNTFRSGRQKGSKTIFSGLPALSTQLEYFGIQNGKVGLSWYMGESNSDAFAGIEKNQLDLVAQADSTTVFTHMIGLHSNFDFKKWNWKSQFIYSHNGNTEAYNAKGNTDLQPAQFGFYSELSRTVDKKGKWDIFARYSYFNSHLNRGENDPSGVRHFITTGANFTPATGAMFKLDFQWSDAFSLNHSLQINSGIAVWF